jgi:hypothetical protein
MGWRHDELIGKLENKRKAKSAVFHARQKALTALKAKVSASFFYYYYFFLFFNLRLAICNLHFVPRPSFRFFFCFFFSFTMT